MNIWIDTGSHREPDAALVSPVVIFVTIWWYRSFFALLEYWISGKIFNIIGARYSQLITGSGLKTY